MYPIICKIGPFTIYSYGLMLVLAFLAASHLAGAQAKKESIDKEIILNLAFVAFISGIIGARVLYVLQNIGHYLANPLEIIMLQYGGLSWFGGLISGSLCAAGYLKKKKLSVYKAMDLVAPFAALAQSIGRLGCFLNGCCYGKDAIPAQLYSSLILVLIFIILRILQERPHKEGRIFFTYLLLYSLKRFFIEFFRGDAQIIFAGLTLFQLMSIAIFIFAAIKCRNIR